MSTGTMITITKDKLFSSDGKTSSKVFVDNSSCSKSSRSEANSENDISNCGMSLMEMGKCLLKCARESDVEGVKKAVYYGAPFSSDWLGMTPLHFAVINNQYEICNMLLANGINKDAKTKVDRTSLHFACFYGHLRIVKLLLLYNCAVSPRDMLRMTPLHWAVEKGFKSIVRLLLQHNADVMGISKFGRSPIDLAVITEQPDILDELQSAKQKQISRALQEEVDLAVKEIDISTKNPVKENINRSNFLALERNITSTATTFSITDKSSTELRDKCKTYKTTIQKEQKLALTTPIIDTGLQLNQGELQDVCLQNNTMVDSAAFKLNSNIDELYITQNTIFHPNKSNISKIRNKTPYKKKDLRFLGVDNSSITNATTDMETDLSIILSQPVATINSTSLYEMGLMKDEPMETDYDEKSNQAGLNQQIVGEDVDISLVAQEVEVETAFEVEVKTEPEKIVLSTEEKSNHNYKERESTVHISDNINVEVNTNISRTSPLSMPNKLGENRLQNFDQLWKEVEGQSQPSLEVLEKRRKQWKQQLKQNDQRDQNKCNYNNGNQQPPYNRKRIIRIMPGSVDQVKKFSSTIIRPYSSTKLTIGNSGINSNTAFPSAINTVSVLPTQMTSEATVTNALSPRTTEIATGLTITTTKASITAATVAPTITPTLPAIITSVADSLATAIIAPTTTLSIKEPITADVSPLINTITTLSSTITSSTKTTATDTSTIDSITSPFANGMPIVPLLTMPEICRQLLELRKQNEELHRKVDVLLQERELIIHRVNQLENSFCLDVDSMKTS